MKVLSSCAKLDCARTTVVSRSRESTLTALYASRWAVPLGGVLIVLAGLLAYHNSYSGPFVYDDVSATVENPTIRHLWPIWDVLSPPRDSGVTVNGRPIVNLTLAINYAISGTAVWSYHVINVLLHLLAALTLFGLVRRTLSLPAIERRLGDAALPLALGVATIWTVHPLQTEAVTYVVQRAESLAGLFYLLTLYCFVRSVHTERSVFWRVLSVGACLLGMATKEIMVSAPLVVFLFDRTFMAGSFAEAWRRRWRYYVGLAATWLLLAYLVVMSGNRGGTAGFGYGVTWWVYAQTQCWAIARYLQLALFPHPLIFDYGTGVAWKLTQVLPQFGLLAGLCAGAVFAVWRWPGVGFVGISFFVLLAPSSSVLPVVTETVAEHRMYLPLVAIVVLAAAVFWLLFGRRSVVFGLGVMAAAIMLTARRNLDYSSDQVLWNDTVRKFPGNARAQNNVGEIAFRQGRKEEAIARFREAVRLLPEYAVALNNLGNVLTQIGRPAEAIPLLERALAAGTELPVTHNNLGSALYRLGNATAAAGHFAHALDLKPDYPEAHSNLGVVLVDLGRFEEAVRHHERALMINPRFVDALYNCGVALSHLGRTEEAIARFKRALAVRPDFPEAHNNLGGILYGQGKLPQATAHFRQAVDSKPDYVDALSNLGVALADAGQRADAIRCFERALQLKPDFQGARDNLARMRAQGEQTSPKP